MPFFVPVAIGEKAFQFTKGNNILEWSRKATNLSGRHRQLATTKSVHGLWVFTVRKNGRKFPGRLTSSVGWFLVLIRG